MRHVAFGSLPRCIMTRIPVVGLFLLFLPACRLPPDRLPLQPLPEDGQVFSYQELLSRARVQATAALESFYVDNWTELADAARGLEQTARFLPKGSDPPAKLVGQVVTEGVALRKDAQQLADAAKAKDATATIAILQRIHLKIRQLHPPPQLEAAKEKK
jgi:hypothetical protein